MRRKIAFIVEELEKLFPDPLPPLNHSNPFTLLVAVLLSASCTDKRVNIVTKTLFSKADTPEKMIQLSIVEIEEIIRSCGLFRNKAKAIFDLSHILIDKYKGKVPPTLKDLESLPGVGHKTASVVLIQAFSIPAFPVDTHIHRLAKRWGLSSGKNVTETERDLKALFPREIWAKLHLQMIYYARAFCPAIKHSEEKCSICINCNSTNDCN
ncbi:MAG: Endonuclease III [Chlamydiia bacterium]|nr:Endonuclease III [Chlamydiia bacterium]MCH9618368.1 Endonuclease III [Chlamydiia bacterium]MCH9624706.1 Endonuclease III [Chlamydiia bacterium]